MRERDINRLDGTISSTLGALAAAGPVAVFALVGGLYVLAFLAYGIKHVSWETVFQLVLWCACVAAAVFAGRLALRSLGASKRVIRLATAVLCIPLVVPFEVSTRAIEGMTGVSYRVFYYKLTGVSTDEETHCIRMRDTGWIHDGTERSVENARDCVGFLKPEVLERTCLNFAAEGKPFQQPWNRAFCAQSPMPSRVGAEKRQ